MAKQTQKSIWDKLGGLDYRIIYATFIILMIIPVVSPLGIPMKVATPVQDYYNTIANLPPNSVILVHSFVDLSVWADTGPILIATWRMLWSIPQSKNISIIAYTSLSDGAVKMDDLLKTLCIPPQWRIDTYGTTWMDMGYISLPDEAMVASFAGNMVAVKATDSHIYDIGKAYKGKAIMDIPICKWVASRGGDPNVLNAADFDLNIWGSWGCTDPDIRVRQFWVAGNPAYELPLLFMTIGNCVPQTVPYYGADKPIKGYVPGSAGAAMLEKLIGMPGDGTIMADLSDLAGIATVFFLVLGNLSYFGKKYFEKKEV